MYSKEWGEVGLFIKKFVKAQHPAILAAIKLFDSWIASAGRGDLGVPAVRTFAKISDRHVAGQQLLHEVLAVLLYSSRRDTPSTRSPFRLCNAALRGASTNTPRGWWAPGAHSPPVPKLLPGSKERREIQLYIVQNLRNVFASFLEHFKEKERLFNEQARALSTGNFPVKKNRKGQVDGRSRLARSQPGSNFPRGTTNPEGKNQYNREADPVIARVPPKTTKGYGPIPYIRARKGTGKGKGKGVPEVKFPRRAD
jgi:hypothetical protein